MQTRFSLFYPNRIKLKTDDRRRSFGGIFRSFLVSIIAALLLLVSPHIVRVSAEEPLDPFPVFSTNALPPIPTPPPIPERPPFFDHVQVPAFVTPPTITAIPEISPPPINPPVLPPAQGPPPLTATQKALKWSEQLFMDGAKAEREGRFDDAEVAYLQCFEWNRDHLDQHHSLILPLHRLAVLLAKQRRFDASERYFQRALRYSGNNIVILSDFSQSYLEQEKYEEAEAVLKKALVVDPADKRILCNLGYAIAYQPGRLEEGLKYFKSALGDEGFEREKANLLQVLTNPTPLLASPTPKPLPPIPPLSESESTPRVMPVPMLSTPIQPQPVRQTFPPPAVEPKLTLPRESAPSVLPSPMLPAAVPPVSVVSTTLLSNPPEPSKHYSLLTSLPQDNVPPVYFDMSVRTPAPNGDSTDQPKADAKPVPSRESTEPDNLPCFSAIGDEPVLPTRPVPPSMSQYPPQQGMPPQRFPVNNATPNTPHPQSVIPLASNGNFVEDRRRTEMQPAVNTDPTPLQAAIIQPLQTMNPERRRTAATSLGTAPSPDTIDAGFAVPRQSPSHGSTTALSARTAPTPDLVASIRSDVNAKPPGDNKPFRSFDQTMAAKEVSGKTTPYSANQPKNNGTGKFWKGSNVEQDQYVLVHDDTVRHLPKSQQVVGEPQMLLTKVPPPQESWRTVPVPPISPPTDSPKEPVVRNERPLVAQSEPKASPSPIISNTLPKFAPPEIQTALQKRAEQPAASEAVSPELLATTIPVPGFGVSPQKPEPKKEEFTAQVHPRHSMPILTAPASPPLLSTADPADPDSKTIASDTTVSKTMVSNAKEPALSKKPQQDNSAAFRDIVARSNMFEKSVDLHALAAKQPENTVLAPKPIEPPPLPALIPPPLPSPPTEPMVVQTAPPEEPETRPVTKVEIPLQAGNGYPDRPPTQILPSYKTSAPIPEADFSIVLSKRPEAYSEPIAATPKATPMPEVIVAEPIKEVPRQNFEVAQTPLPPPSVAAPNLVASPKPTPPITSNVQAELTNLSLLIGSTTSPPNETEPAGFARTATKKIFPLISGYKPSAHWDDISLPTFEIDEHPIFVPEENAGFSRSSRYYQ